MATWINRGKKFYGNAHPDGVDVSNADLLEIAQAEVSHRRSWWVTMLGKLETLSNSALPNAVINPAPGSNAWDIGTLDEDDNYTPFSVNDTNKCLALFGPWSYNKYEIRAALRKFRKEEQVLGAPAATETPAQANLRRETESDAYAVTKVGDADGVQPDV